MSARCIWHVFYFESFIFLHSLNGMKLHFSSSEQGWDMRWEKEEERRRRHDKRRREIVIFKGLYPNMKFSINFLLNSYVFGWFTHRIHHSMPMTCGWPSWRLSNFLMPTIRWNTNRLCSRTPQLSHIQIEEEKSFSIFIRFQTVLSIKANSTSDQRQPQKKPLFSTRHEFLTSQNVDTRRQLVFYTHIFLA